jgi:hypothetical protein
MVEFEEGGFFYGMPFDVLRHWMVMCDQPDFRNAMLVSKNMRELVLKTMPTLDLRGTSSYNYVQSSCQCLMLTHKHT